MVAFDDMAHWRTQIFSQLLSIVTALGIVAAVPSMALALHDGLWSIIAIDIVALTWLLALWRAKCLSYNVRVLNLLAMLYFVGVSMMLTVGPISQGYLLAPPVLGAVLLGLRPALGALALASVTMLVLSLTGYARLYVTGRPEYALVPSLVITLNFVCVGLLLTITSSTLLQRLARSLGDLRGQTQSLQENRDKLAAVNAELRLTSAAVARLNEMVMIAEAVPGTAAEQPITFVNDAFLRRTGYRREELMGQSMRMLHGPLTDALEVERVVAAMHRTEAVTAELMNYTKSGEPYLVEMEMVPFADEGGVNTHWVVVGRDITERKRAADAIHNLAFYDVLTGLPNRRLLMDRLERMLAAAQREQRYGAVIFIDLDHFKFINDARGHATGDSMLRKAAQRLTQLVRSDDTVARLGGDEFVVLLQDLGRDVDAATRAALAMAERIRDAIGKTFDIDGQSYTSSASVGVAVLPRANQTVHDLLREADIAMYRAKADGRNGVALFESTMRAEVERRLTMERDLSMALENGELQMHLQLQVSRDSTPVGAELLMRWRRTDGTSIPPDVFIPVAEATGQIVPLGRWALRQACLSWLRLEAEGQAMPLSVNVSPSQFRQPDFVADVRAILQETGAPATQLIFEVTEGLLIENLDDTIERMHELARLGIRFSIDDFGTGYSNLAYLKRMPLYELKIDRSFIHDMPGDANGTAIVQSIMAMAGHLGLRVVAEGVETQEQATFLAEHGSPGMQGYLFARPMPLGDVITLLSADTNTAAG
ncbi:phosphodiesterase [Pseudoduganella plicata]|uniref:Phosphodiesterase n=1 Tax=Pseudoduganella plicata TaxID=321984 RepID=A0ABX5SCL6_9BURK|nr:phosphodiesterase [Pseudoduganella plicata]